MPSTETKHLTSLNFDLTQMQQQLASIPATVEQAAKNAQDAWNNNFKAGGGTGSGATGGGGKSGVETAVTATKAQLESLMLAYKNFETMLSRTTSHPEAISKLRTEARQAITDLEGLAGRLDKNGKVTGANAKQYQDLSSKLKKAKGDVAELKTQVNDTATVFDKTGKTVEETGTGIRNFLGKLGDKARWLAAFYLIQGIINGFKALVTTVKETETTVVELQRVLNENVSSENISSELYAIASEYGRTFAEVQESAVLFAQTGKSWDDVLTLTRGTMLALNTAELDVTQATQGLIAVMAQWKLGAEDYVSIIDKINKTADDYAITSEAIVAALQRSGGTAKAYGMTLEELIGVITALSEATGRSGENLGTAINSLITYTTKASSVEVFKKMKIDAEDAEGNLRPVLEIWSQLAQKIKGGDLAFADFMATDQAAIGEFLANNEEYQQLVDQELANGKEIQTIYSAAGTYRKNYFIALLNNLGTAEEAVRGMTDAEGYSVTENEKYMATLAAISNQLKAAWQQLAVTFGDASFLKFLKWVTNLGIGIAELISATGGLQNALFTVLGIFIMLKQEQISEMFLGIGRTLKSFKTGVDAAGKSVSALQTAFGWIGLVMTALSLLVGAINGVNSALEASREKLLEAGDAARRNTESLNDLVNKYIELANSSDFQSGNESSLASAKSIHESIVELLGDQASGWDLVNGKVDENIQKLREAQLESARKAQNDLTSAKTVAESQLNSFQQIVLGQVNIIQSALKKSGNNDYLTGANAKLQFAAMTDGAEGVLELLKQWQADFIKLGSDGSDALAIISSQIEYYQGLVSDAETATKNWSENEAMIKALEARASGLITTQAEFDNYIEILNQAEVQERVTAEYADALREAMAALYPEFSNAADAVIKFDDSLSEGAQSQALYATELEKIRALISDVSKEMDDAQGAYDALQSIISEYNETGIMSVDMLQQLMELEPEYIALLDISSSGISLNQEATDSLVESKLKLIETNLALKEAEYASAIAAEFNAYATDEAYDAANQSANASYSAASGLQALVSSAYSTGMSVEAVADQLYALGYVQSATGSKAIAMANQILTASQAMYTLRAAAGSALGTLASFTGTSATGSTGKSSGGGGGGGGEDPQVKILEARKKAIEEEADAQIAALKKVQEAEDRKRRRDEYLADKSEALADVRRAQSRSGIDAREDEADAEKKLADVNKDWQEQLQDWNLDDQIAAIEEWKDAMVEAIDEQLDALRGGGGGGGGGGTIADVFANEAEVLTQNKDVLLAALAEMDNENLAEKIKEFYKLFDASQYTSDVDFGEKLSEIKTQWDTFSAENGDKWAIHYNMVLDNGSTMTPEQINDYINGLLGKATSESDLLRLDKEGLGILLRVTPDSETNKETEDQWSQTVTDLGEALDKMLSLWEFDNLDTDSVKKAIEDAFGGAFDAAKQTASDSGVVISQQMAKSADDAGASMLASVNSYSPQIVDAWNNNLINPMITSIGELSTSLDDVLSKLGQVASFNGIGIVGGGVGTTTNNTTQSQNNFVTIRGNGKSRTDALGRWFL